MTTKIPWTDEVWNLWHGCTKIAAGCKNCYSEQFHKRFHAGTNFNELIMYPERIEQPLHWKKPRRIFVNSMSDLFYHRFTSDNPQAAVFLLLNEIHQIIYECKQHTFIVLTKRPLNALKYYNELCVEFFRNMENLWLGVSISTQEDADRLIPLLLQIQAAVRIVSVEPMLERIDLSKYLLSCKDCGNRGSSAYVPFDEQLCRACIKKEESPSLDWVIIGAESGHNRRWCPIEYIYDLKVQCKNAGVPIFIKQIHQGRLMELEKDITKFPEDLQIQEYPNEMP